MVNAMALDLDLELRRAEGLLRTAEAARLKSVREILQAAPGHPAPSTFPIQFRAPGSDTRRRRLV